MRPKEVDKFQQVISQLKVLAVSNPSDKYLLVAGLRYLGNIVAVTGDGISDFSALKNADVGFLLGINGTE